MLAFLLWLPLVTNLEPPSVAMVVKVQGEGSLRRGGATPVRLCPMTPGQKLPDDASIQEALARYYHDCGQLDLAEKAEAAARPLRKGGGK
jgi:hypothetical protein